MKEQYHDGIIDSFERYHDLKNRVESFAKSSNLKVTDIDVVVEHVQLQGGDTLYNYDIGEFEFRINVVRGNAYLNGLGLSTLHNLPESCEELDLSHNEIISLCGIHNHVTQCNSIDLSFNPIEEGGVGMVLINNLTEILYIGDNQRLHEALGIITNYIDCFGKGKGTILYCQQELIDAGLEEFARL